MFGFGRNKKEEAPVVVQQVQEKFDVHPIQYVTDMLKDYHHELVQKEVESLTELNAVQESFDDVRDSNDALKAKLTEFDDIFQKYGVKAEIEMIKTTNMGALIDVTYRITMTSTVVSKSMLDDLRTRNANLSVMITNTNYAKETL